MPVYRQNALYIRDWAILRQGGATYAQPRAGPLLLCATLPSGYN